MHFVGLCQKSVKFPEKRIGIDYPFGKWTIEGLLRVFIESNR